MSTDEKVKVTIRKDGSGKMTFDLDGFVGDSCDSITAIEQKLAAGDIDQEDHEDKYQYEIPDEIGIDQV